MIRIPKQLLDTSRLDEFISEVDEVELHAAGKNVIVKISFNAEESGTRLRRRRRWRAA